MEDFVEPWTHLGQKFKHTRNSQFTQLIPSKKDTTIHHGRPGESLLLPRVGKPSKTSPPLPPVILIGQNNSISLLLNQTLRLSVANKHDLYWESSIPWMNRTGTAAVNINVMRTPPAIPSHRQNLNWIKHSVIAIGDIILTRLKNTYLDNRKGFSFLHHTRSHVIVMCRRERSSNRGRGRGWTQQRIMKEGIRLHWDSTWKRW